MPDPAEQELLRQARDGDQAAFERLQEELGWTIRRYVWRLIGQSEAEDEVVQDAFLALYMNLERIDPVENLRPFLFRIVRNRCYDELRKRGRFDVVSLDVAPDDTERPPSWLTDRAPQPDEALLGHLLWEEVQQAIERLPEVQRQTMILYAGEDFSYAQIAAALGTNIGTVKSRLHHARRNLRRLLGPEALEALGIQHEKEHEDGRKRPSNRSEGRHQEGGNDGGDRR